MKVIGYTDVIQVVVLIIGGLATTYIALTLVADHFGLGKDAVAVFNKLLAEAPDHFHMMLWKPGPDASPSYVAKYLAVPAGMYFAGQWIANLYYWGCNQYITQRALGAELETARKGLLFAGFLKLLMPVIVMLPGIAAYGAPQGLELLREIAQNVFCPVYAIGGINARNLGAVKGTGVHGVALISAVLSAADPRQAAEELTRLL